MKRDLRFVLVSLLFVALLSVASFAQDQTGNLEITAKDAAGAVVPNVSVTITGESGGFKRTVQTDDNGFVRVIQLQPGNYTITTAAIQGFVAQTIPGVSVGLGGTTPVNVQMSTTLVNVVDVSGNDSTGLDINRNDVTTTISSRVAELIPKGLNFNSALKFSAATRPEPRSGQFQIDGASGSENTFVVDGQEVTDILSGALDRNVNLPFSIIQETQIKSSGFEAEFGGATGGVINVVTKSGGNSLQGEFGVNLRSSRAEPIGGNALTTINGLPGYYPSRRNQYNETNPTATLLGPVWKDKVFFVVSYSPQIFRQDRVLNYVTVPGGRTEHYFARTRAEKTFVRLDAQPFSKLHLTSTFKWNPEANTGVIPSYASELLAVPKQAVPMGAPVFDGAKFLNQTGGRLNSVNFTFGGNYVISNNLVVGARFGHYFLNNKLGTYGNGNITIPRVNCAPAPLSKAEFPDSFGCKRVANAMFPSNNGVTAFADSLYDATGRDQLDADVTYSFNAFGTHELKGGYQRNAISNKVQDQNTDVITIRSGTVFPSRIGDFSGVSGIPSAPGAIGSGQLSIVQTQGDVHSKNVGVFFQDKWQPNRRLTLNLGVRAEQEDVPSFSVGQPGLNFNWGSKIAPRLGAAYDVTGDGKTVVKVFYGLFYDRFKLTLPRGSFGGDQFHNLFFDVFATDNINNLNRATIMGSATAQPIAGGACPTGTQTAVYGRVRCDRDERINSNTPGQDINEAGGIDPSLKPFRQRELTFQFSRVLSNNYTLLTRYSRKQVIRTIEDVGFVNSEGSTAYLIANPGEGLAKSKLAEVGLIAPKAQRDYDAFEVILNRRFANHYFFSANYTLSRLYGNYGGLASSDEEGRLDPNVERYFDEPSAGFTVLGGPDNGRLPTDRPHVFKAFGAYELDWDRIGLWKSHATDFQFFYTVTSGSLITSFANIRGVEQIIFTKRGDQGRTPIFSQTDFAVRHNIKFGRDGRFKLIIDADIINLFNQGIVLNRGRNPDGQGGNIIDNTKFDILDPVYGLITVDQRAACSMAHNDRPCFATAFQNFQRNGAPNIIQAVAGGAGANPFYNLDSSYQAKRTIRYGIRLVF